MESRWISALAALVFLITEGSCLSLELAALQKEYGEWRLQRSPEYSTTIGIYKHNDQVENFAYSGFEEEYNKCLSLLSRLKEKVSYNQLDAKEKIDYDIFNDSLSTIVQGYDWRDYNALNPVNFLEGPQIDPTYMPKTTPFDTVGDYENYIRRLELQPTQIDDMIERFNQSIEKGHTYHSVSVSRVPGQIEKLVSGYNTTSFPYYKPLLDQLSKLQTIDDSIKTKFKERAETAVAKIIQKLSDLKHYLENVYFNHLRTGFGVNSWNNGAAFYRACLRWHLSLDMTPEEVHNKGLEEVERISFPSQVHVCLLNSRPYRRNTENGDFSGHRNTPPPLVLSRLKAQVNYHQLDANEKIDYDIFNDSLSTIVQGYDWRDYNALNPVNFLEGPQIDPTYMPKTTPFDTVGDYENYIRRLELHPTQIDDMIMRFNKSIEKGHTHHSVSVNRVPGQIEKLLTGYNTTSFPYYKPLLDQLSKLQTIDDSKKKEFRERAETAVEKIMQKFSDLKHYFQNVYFNHLRTGFGVNSWNNGATFYRACLRWHLSLDITPEEVHNKGLEEVERISSEMKKVMVKLNHQGSVKDFFDKIRSDPTYHLQTGDEIVQWYKNAIKNDIQPKISAYFKDLPNLPIDVEPNPTDGVSGQYIPGPPDGSRPGVFQVNVHRPNKSIIIGFMALLLHETMPGHHLQISVASTVENPEYRKYMTGHFFNIPIDAPFYTSYVEGWALYAEYLGEEMKLYKTDYDLMGRYGYEIYRACRLVVDTGLHHYNWTRQKAIEYMLNYTAFSEEGIAIEIDRYITWPGQACAYKIGELKIKELRKKAEDELGSKFDIRDFHASILKVGPIPLHILEKNVNHWILKTKNKAAGSTTKCTTSGANTNTNWRSFTVIMSIVFLQQN